MARRVRIQSSHKATRLVLTFLWICAGAAGASAGADSCEKIKDADAYNACLASFGPAVGERKFTAAPREDSAGKPVADKAAASRLGARGHYGETRKTEISKRAAGPARQANGRVRIEIFPGK